MRKGKTVIGQDVLSLADGQKIETVKDLLISQSNDAIVALLVDEGGLLSSSKIVPIEEVQDFGRNAVVITDPTAVTRASSYPEAKEIIDRKDSLLGKRVFTDGGQQMGTISDMYFDENGGRILGFEVSGGVIGDIARGTSYLAVEEIERIGPDVVFIAPASGEALESQVGGVQGALQKAGDRMGELGTQAGEGLSGMTAQAQEGLRQREPEKGLIGRRAGMDVTDENGSVIVANGQRITAQHAEWAKSTDNVGLLTRAATAGETQEFGQRLGSALEQAGDSAATLWDRFTARLGEMRDENGRQVDVQYTRSRLAQIADAIGRPVTKVILDKKDDVILDFGDIITHQAVQRAYDAGMLDTLLASTYREGIAIPPQQLRADVPASSTVKQASGGAAVLDELQRKLHESEQQKAEREEREHQAAEAQRLQREREREERARQRDEAERQRLAEIDAARAAQPASSQSSAPTEPQPSSPAKVAATSSRSEQPS
jgi:uncharacterized protein YrrD